MPPRIKAVNDQFSSLAEQIAEKAGISDTTQYEGKLFRWRQRAVSELSQNPNNPIEAPLDLPVQLVMDAFAHKPKGAPTYTPEVATLINEMCKLANMEVIIPQVGELAIPRLHEVFKSENDPKVPQFHIVRTVSPGYIHNGRLMQKPRVVISDS